jgi:hypothetical protein
MSIWYQCKVHAISKGRAAVAKFFGLNDSHEDVRTDMFEFSFGGKNAPSLTLRKIVQQNPDLIFLVEQHIECDTVEWFLTRFSTEKNEQQFFWIQDFGSVTNKISKKLLEEYDAYSHELTMKHLEGLKGFEDFRWTMFLNDFDKIADRLNRAEEYKEMVNPWVHFNIKNYMIEYECNYGHGDEPHFLKEWQGPHPMAKIESIKEDIAKRIKEGRLAEGDIKNINVREVEPK